MLQRRVTAYEPGLTWAEHYARNQERIDGAYETFAREEITPEALEQALRQEIRDGVCLPTLLYFFAVQDCLARFSNYTVDTSARLGEAVSAVVDSYRRYLGGMRDRPTAKRVLVITRAPLDLTQSTGWWRYRLAAESHLTDPEPVAAYAYIQTPAE